MPIWSAGARRRGARTFGRVLYRKPLTMDELLAVEPAKTVSSGAAPVVPNGSRPLINEVCARHERGVGVADPGRSTLTREGRRINPWTTPTSHEEALHARTRASSAL